MVAKQHFLSTDDCQRSLVLELESTNEDRLMAYESIKWNKEKVGPYYNKHVHNKGFEESDLVWKIMLLLVVIYD